MDWKHIVGHKQIIDDLKNSITHDRVSHAQIFHAPEGSGGLPLALAYVKTLFLSFNGNENTSYKIENPTHPDLHFIFPTSSTDKIKADKTESQLFLKDWRNFIKSSPYGNLTDWLTHIKIEKKQGLINVRDAEAVIEKTSLKSYEGGYKATIIWMAEKMNTQAANKLLKIIEEPPEKTVFILITEKINEILPTILSRCQLVKINAPSHDAISNYLIEQVKVAPSIAGKIASLCQGNINSALKIVEDSEKNHEFENYFVHWVRSAFIAKTNLAALQDLTNWTNEIHTWGREKQKSFLIFSISIFRGALLCNYNYKTQHYNFQNVKFNWSTFCSYIHGANIEDILEELNKAHYHIERNINAKLVFLDASIKITRFLHKKMS